MKNSVCVDFLQTTQGVGAEFKALISSPLTSKEEFLYFLYFIYCLYVWVCPCGGQMTTCESRFSPTTGSRDQTQTISFSGKCFTPSAISLT